MIGQFLNPRLNHRADDYGGTVENRARFLLEVVEAVTAIWDSPRIGVKMSPYWSNGTTFEATEETLAGFDHAIGHLGEAGASYLHLMGSAPADSGSGDDRAKLYERYRRMFTGTLVANVGFTQATANRIIQAGIADAVSFGAAYIANPDLVDRFATGQSLSAPNPATIYGEGAEGYTDYPTISGERG